MSHRNFASRAADPGPPPSVPARSISPVVGPQSRPSNASARSALSGAGSRRLTRETSNGGSGSSMPLSQIEKSVTHLLVATKQLLETLTQWSRGQASDAQVSDVYVRLGYEFNMACRAFTAINVDTSDLGNVPDLLRQILEATLSQEASSESLEKYLPKIRDIIINLLHGLKRKQQKLRQKQSRERDGSAPPERATSVSTVESGASGLTNLLDEGIENGGYQGGPSRASSQAQDLSASPTRRFEARQESSRASVASEQSSLSSNTLQNMPVLPPYPSEDNSMPSHPSNDTINPDSFPQPPPPPSDSQASALAALQKGGDLERRASRRYSQYQISKHLGGAATGMPMLPPQTTPIPNRGRKEARESLRAVQKRESVRQAQKPSDTTKISLVELPSGQEDQISANLPSTRSDMSKSDSTLENSSDVFKPSATLNGPIEDVPYFNDSSPARDKSSETMDALEGKNEKATPSTHSIRTEPPSAAGSRFQASQVSPPPTPTKDLTLFLQYKSKVKKTIFPEGRDQLTIGRLQLAFIEKFSWNTQQNGTDLPEIYIQDPVSGVRHELEDLSDVQDRTVLVLNVEHLDEVKRHIDDGILTLTKIVQDVKQTVDDQGTALQRVSDRQQETASEIAKFVATPLITPSSEASRSPISGGRKLGGGHLAEVQTLRRDLAVLRQTYSSFQSEIQASMTTLRTKATTVKTAVSKVASSNLDGDAGYTYVKKGRKQLNADSDHLVGKVDDLQDLIEDLRKDVVNRGVRPLPRQLEGVTRDVADLSKELKRMEDYISQEKPVWTKIWERELEDVCQGRDELRLMEDLLVDLRDDLEKASETFTLVEQATKEQLKDNGTGQSASSARQFSKGLENLGNSLDQNAAKEGVLGEVRALQPNHENRLEAIERAEKLRQKELLTREDDALQQEIRDFVADGKLKKSGGFEEVERSRKAKDDKARKEIWEQIYGYAGEEGEFEDGEDEFQEAEEAQNQEPV